MNNEENVYKTILGHFNPPNLLDTLFGGEIIIL
jgi:hypothetical protein